MCKNFNYGELTRDATGNFKLDVFKRKFTPIILGGSGTIVHGSCNGR